MNFQLKRYPSNKDAKPILVPRQDIDWEVKAVFNPSVVYDKGVFKMLYRTYPARLGLTTPKMFCPGYFFRNQTSYIGYAESKDGINFERRDTPFISPDTAYDGFGCEDPRITKIGDTFYITYTAIDGSLERIEKGQRSKTNVRIAMASTKDFITLKKHGIIGPPTWSKAAAFFPEKVKGGKIGLLMTIGSDTANSQVMARYYDSMEDVVSSSVAQWDELLKSGKPTLRTYSWLHRGPELGAAPVKTDRGWLLIYSTESMGSIWTVGAALLDIDNPDILLAKSAGNILQPATLYERDGLVPNVTFPEGAVIVEDELYVYYGAADTVIGLATCKLDELLGSLKS